MIIIKPESEQLCETKHLRSYTVQPSKHCFTRIAPFVLLNPDLHICNKPETIDAEFIGDLVHEVGTALQSNKRVFSISGKYANSRSCLYFVPVLVGMFDSVLVYVPQGCTIGKRPVEFYIDIAKRFGIHVDDRGDCIKFSNHVGGDHDPVTIDIQKRSFTGTQWALILAVSSRRRTAIVNPSNKPETLWLINELKRFGCRITGDTESVLVVDPSRWSHGNQYTVIPHDRNEILFASCCALAARMEFCMPLDNWSAFESVTEVFDAIGVSYRVDSTGFLFVNGKCTEWMNSRKELELNGVLGKGLDTDFLPLLAAVMAMRKGKTTIVDHVFEDRIHKVVDSINGIHGKRLCTARCSTEILCTSDGAGTAQRFSTFRALDLRHGAALIISSLFQEQQVNIENEFQILRGFRSHSLIQLSAFTGRLRLTCTELGQ